MNTDSKIKPACGALDDAPMVIIPVCVTLADLNLFMVRFNKGKTCARGWADLQLSLWRNPQQTIWN